MYKMYLLQRAASLKLTHRFTLDHFQHYVLAYGLSVHMLLIGSTVVFLKVSKWKGWRQMLVVLPLAHPQCLLREE